MAFEKCVKRTFILLMRSWDFVVAKISRLRRFRKILRVLLECYICSENGRGKKKLREFSSIRCLTFVMPLVSQLLQKTGALFILINEFCNRVRERKWSFDTTFLSKKVSDQISRFHECTIRDCQDCAPIMELHSPSFGSFKSITEDETYSIIMNLAKTLCALDRIPTPLLVISALTSSYRSKLKWLIFHLKVAIFPQHGRGFGSTNS